jgi:hypothetical protein
MSTHTTLKNVSLAVALLGTILVRAENSTPPTTISSPSGKYKLTLKQIPMPGIAALQGDSTLALVANGRGLSQFPTFGYLADAFWSPDERYVAVNNRRGNQGDYVWVFSLKDGKAIKAPDEIPGEVFADRASRDFPEVSVETFHKWWNVAKRWTQMNELETESRLVFSNLPEAFIDRIAIYRVEGDKFVQIRESFKKVKRSDLPP